MTKRQLMVLRDTLYLHDEIPEAALDGDDPPYYRPEPGSPEHEYLMTRRKALAGSLPQRLVRAKPLPEPADATFTEFATGSKGRPVSTTMAFAILIRNLLRDPSIGSRVVPIIPDEARTFGLDGLFAEVKIYASTGQLYEPVDAGMQLSYRESAQGQILEEGITEEGSMASLCAAGTSYATWATPMVPFYLFYSMFGFQRTGDLIWAFGDMRGRGFMLGGTAGRTTLNGEGLQHEDGHSLVLGSTIPNLRAYDPAFAYETAEIIRDGIRRMYTTPFDDPAGDCFYYLTLYNENYVMPAMPDGGAVPADPSLGTVTDGIVRGLYRFAPAPEGKRRRATVLFSGSAWLAAEQAQRILADEWDCGAELWSATSYKALREDALSVERTNRLHPSAPAESPFVTRALEHSEGPVVAVTDFMKQVPDMVSRWVPRPFTALGTDGYGRSDTRAALRRHFETDAANVVVAVLSGLASQGEAKPEEVADAIARYGIDADAPDPRTT